MVAADNHLAGETAAAAKALRELAATAGPIAEADAHMVNADLEFEGMQGENGNLEARAAVAGYSPYCESRDAAMAAQCDAHNWFYALMFAGYGGQGERNSGAAAIYLHMALDAALGPGNAAWRSRPPPSSPRSRRATTTPNWRSGCWCAPRSWRVRRATRRCAPTSTRSRAT